MNTYAQLQEINRRPDPFAEYTAAELWTDDHTSSQMLDHHLDPSSDLSSRNAAFIERSAAWIAQRFDLTAGRSVADFGCGPGLYTTRFAAAGADTTGIDFSERSLEHAREQARSGGLSIDYLHGNYLEIETDARFDLITLIMCDFCALSPGQRGRLLDTFRAHLEPGGAVLLDVYSLRGLRRERGAGRRTRPASWTVSGPPGPTSGS